MEHTPIPVPLDGITDVAEVGGGVHHRWRVFTDGSSAPGDDGPPPHWRR